MEAIPVSTKTIIATSNLYVDIRSVFEKIEPGVVKNQEVTLLTLYFQNNIRGDTTCFKKTPKKCFRNAVNAVVRVQDGKLINFKLSKNGKFQLTGCKNEKHAILAVAFFIESLFQYCPEAVTIEPKPVSPRTDEVWVAFHTVMTNIDFSLGFCVDRQKLDHVLNEETPFHSLLETSFGYTGVNIKFQVESPWWKQKAPVLRIPVESLRTADEKETPSPRPWITSMETLENYLDLTPENKQKKRYNTFLVFHSGNVIMSGMMRSTMEPHYLMFMDLIRQCRPKIEEKICLPEDTEKDASS